MPSRVDFHCHLDLYPDLALAIEACETSRTATLAVTTTPKAFRQNKRMAQGAEFVRIGLGLHPHLVEERRSEMALFEALLPETRYVGEVGLDAGPRFYGSMPQQLSVFRQVLSLCNAAGNKILSIHSVRTAGQVLDCVEELLPRDSGRVVLHWFSGSQAEARRAAELGCYFSVNQAMLARERGRTLVASLPEDRLLTETDGPFVESDVGPIGPGDVSLVVERLSALLDKNAADVQRQIVRNLIALVS